MGAQRDDDGQQVAHPEVDRIDPGLPVIQPAVERHRDAVEQIRQQVLDVTVQRLDRSRPAGRQREHRRGRGARDGARRARDLPQGERKVDGWLQGLGRSAAASSHRRRLSLSP